MSLELIRLTKRGRAFVVTLCVLVGLSFASPNNDIFISLLIPGLSLVLLLTSSYHLLVVKTRVVSKLNISRVIEGPRVEQEVHDMQIELENPTAFPIYCSEVRDSPPHVFKLPTDSPHFALLVPPKGRSVVKYSFIPVMGRHEFGELRVLIRDPFGLLFAEIPIGGKTKVKIRPKVGEVRERRLWRTMVTAPFGTSRARVKGVGQEFADIRSYEYGDDYRRIEWKSTARTGKLMVKDYELEAHLRVLFVLDATTSMLHGVLGNTKLEYSVRAIASVSKFLLERGDHVGLVVYEGRGEVKTIPMLRGRGKLIEIVDALSEINPIGGDKRGLLRALASSISRGTKWGKNLIILISDLEDFEEDLLSELAELASKNKETQK